MAMMNFLTVIIELITTIIYVTHIKVDANGPMVIISIKINTNISTNVINNHQNILIKFA